MILGFTHGYKPIDAKNGHNVLMQLESGDHEIYVIMFYSQGAIGSDIANINDEYERALISQVLDKNDNFYYAKIDAKNPEFDELILSTEIVVNELEKSPSILIIENSKGVWIHGPETVAKIGEFAELYKKRNQKK